MKLRGKYLNVITEFQIVLPQYYILVILMR